MSPSSIGLAASAALTLAALLVAPAAHAGPGMQVVKDPVTGELRVPTADEAKALRAAKPASAIAKPGVRRGLATGAINPQPVVHPNGMVSVELDEDSLAYSVARKNPDGSISQVCVTGPQAAARAMKSGSQPPQHTHVAKEQRYEEK